MWKNGDLFSEPAFLLLQTLFINVIWGWVGLVVYRIEARRSEYKKFKGPYNSSFKYPANGHKYCWGYVSNMVTRVQLIISRETSALLVKTCNKHHH